MFGVEFFVAFGIGMLVSAIAMTFYPNTGEDLRQLFDKLKEKL
jgi:Na+/melibiose symporter-like transporter